MQKYVIIIYEALKKKESVLLFLVCGKTQKEVNTAPTACAVLCSHPVKIIRPVSYIRENKLFFFPLRCGKQYLQACQHLQVCV